MKLHHLGRCFAAMSLLVLVGCAVEQTRPVRWMVQTMRRMEPSLPLRDFRQAKQHWARRPFQAYSLVLQYSSPDSARCEQELEVHDERVTSVVRNTCQVEAMTVSDVFDLYAPYVEGCDQHVVYDPVLGYPRHAFWIENTPNKPLRLGNGHIGCSMIGFTTARTDIRVMSVHDIALGPAPTPTRREALEQAIRFEINDPQADAGRLLRLAACRELVMGVFGYELGMSRQPRELQFTQEVLNIYLFRPDEMQPVMSVGGGLVQKWEMAGPGAAVTGSFDGSCIYTLGRMRDQAVTHVVVTYRDTTQHSVNVHDGVYLITSPSATWPVRLEALDASGNVLYVADGETMMYGGNSSYDMTLEQVQTE